MRRIQKTVFISYRRTDEPWGLAIFQDLTQHGYDVFIDYDGIGSGKFETVIFENIKARAHFLVLLTPTALEHCRDPKDWMRREIEAAIDNKRNIVPVMLEGFDFDTPAIAVQLDGKLEGLKNYNGLAIPKGLFPQTMQRLRERFLNVPIDAVLEEASVPAQAAATEQKDRATRALADNPEDELLRKEGTTVRSVDAPVPPPQAWRQVLSSAKYAIAGTGLFATILYAGYVNFLSPTLRERVSGPVAPEVPTSRLEPSQSSSSEDHLWENVDVNKNDVAFKIKNHIFCETVDALRLVRKNVTINSRPGIPDSYDVHVQLTLTTEEPATTNSSVARTDKSNFDYNVGRITASGANSWCHDPQLGIGPLNASGPLRIEEFLFNAAKGRALHSALGGKNDSYSYETKFAVITNGSISPSWKLVNLTADTNTLPTGERTRAHDLVLTFGARTK
jgi:hypothetical protein